MTILGTYGTINWVCSQNDGFFCLDFAVCPRNAQVIYMKGHSMSLFKLGKTRIPHKKSTSGLQAVRMAPPATVSIPMSQHIGAPATPTVKAGDTVFVGTLIGEAGGFVSAPIYSSVSGTVKKIDGYLQSSGRSVPTVIIESDGLMTPDPEIQPPSIESFADLSAAARKCGLVGLGGAGFPTSVKLDPSKISSIDSLILNGAECEPYITSDTRTMLDEAEYIKSGVELFERLTDIKDIIIGIEKNKPECISKMREMFEGDGRVRVAPLPTGYPQGAEKVLIYNTTGRIIPEGGLPSDVGAIVMNVTTLATLAKYVKTGMPLVEKCVTVDGSAVSAPKNLIVPIGASIESVIEAAGGLKCEAGKILYGGPMMGVAVYSTSDPILKNTNAITVLDKKDAAPKKENPCIHCGRCVSICPIGLNPTVYARSMKVDDPTDRAERLSLAKINLCIECGSCSFVCPSARPLVEFNRLAKADLREFNAKKAKEDSKK